MGAGGRYLRFCKPGSGRNATSKIGHGFVCNGSGIPAQQHHTWHWPRVEIDRRAHKERQRRRKRRARR